LVISIINIGTFYINIFSSNQKEIPDLDENDEKEKLIKN
jgi:hypothetical protein